MERAASVSKPQSTVSDTTHHDADATAYDYGDGSGSEYGYTDADVNVTGNTPSTMAGSTRKGKKRSRLYVDPDDKSRPIVCLKCRGESS